MKPLYTKGEIIGVDLFAGAGGMSLGARLAGINVRLAIDKDSHAAATYAHNHRSTHVIVADIKDIAKIDVAKGSGISVLFGGPPCQGFSTSNQRTRGSNNKANWLFKEFIRIVNLWRPDWVVFENVRGIVETEQGIFRDHIINGLEDLGYKTSSGILCSSGFGVPQVRSRFFVVGSIEGIAVEMPRPSTKKPVTVKQAISDLPGLQNGARIDFLPYPVRLCSRYAKTMRNGGGECGNHIVTNNAEHVVDRYKHIPQGGNWENIPKELMTNYKDRSRCHTGIYRRLRWDKPSVVIGNYRKNMLVHPTEHRGLSVREAARLQSFPDWYEFKGSIGFQQQQVGNAVPPLLAAAVFSLIVEKVAGTRPQSVLYADAIRFGNELHMGNN